MKKSILRLKLRDARQLQDNVAKKVEVKIEKKTKKKEK